MYAGVNIATMKKTLAPPARRRSKLSPRKKATLVYFTEEDRQLVDEAARIERRSVSSLIANVIMEAADSILARNREKKKGGFAAPQRTKPSN